MRRNFILPWFAALALALLIPAAPEAQGWEFLGTSDLFLGQYFFSNSAGTSAGSLNGYADLDFQQARSYSSRSGFFINERSIYSGFEQVNELAGGGILFQQSWDNSLGAKWIQRFGDGYSVQPRIGFKSELFRETSDEKWGAGLYDFLRYETGVTLERKTRLGLSIPWTYQFSYDLYYTHYPHFYSLASQFGAQLAAPNPGAHVLDAVTNQLSYRSEFDFPGFASAWLLYSLSFVNFTDEHVVNSQGQYLSPMRSDALQTLNVGYSKRLLDWQHMGRVRPTVGMSVTLSDSISNQNAFDTDPNRLKYVGGYYNYWETHLTPNVALLFLRTLITLRVGYDFGYRAYSGRLAQLSDGTYTNNNLYQFTHSMLVEASYPLLRSLDFKVRGIWSMADSNTHYEQTYTYNYTGYNYFAGIEWRL